MTDLPDMGAGLDALADIADIAVAMLEVGQRFHGYAKTLDATGCHARAEAAQIVAALCLHTYGVATEAANRLDPDRLTTLDVASTRHLNLLCRAVTRAQAHLHHLADEETPDGHV